MAWENLTLVDSVAILIRQHGQLKILEATISGLLLRPFDERIDLLQDLLARVGELISLQ